MALEYRSADYKPPCTWGLTVWGVLFLTAGALLLVVVAGGALIFLATFARPPAPGSPAIPISPAKMFRLAAFGFALYGVAAIGLLWLGIGLLRKRRWVRPWILAGCAWILVMFTATLPSSLLSTIFSPLRSGNSFFVLLPTVAIVAVTCGVVLGLFRYFYKPEMVESLRHYDPEPTRWEGWPEPLFCTAFIAIVTSCTGLASTLLLLLNFEAMPTITSVLTVALSIVSSACMLIGGIQCLRKPALGWQILMASILITVLSGLATSLFMRDSKSGFVIETASADELMPPVWVMIVAAMTTPAAFMLMLWRVRPHFLAMRSVATPSSAQPTVIPVAQLDKSGVPAEAES